MKESVHESRLSVQPLLSRLCHRGKGKSLRSMELGEELRNRSRQISPAHFKVYLFIFGFLGLHCCVGFLLGARASLQLQCVGFCLQWLLLFRSMSSRACGLQELQRLSFSSCSRRASLVAAYGLSSCGSWAPECRCTG